MRSWLVGVVLVGAATLPGPSELLSSAAAPDGYVLLGEPARDIDFDEFAAESPYSVGHVEADETADITAALDVWALGETDVLLREVSAWPDAETATEFVAEITEYTEEIGLDDATAPFEGAIAFSGADDENDVWIRMVVWSDGRIGTLVNHFSAGAGTDPGSRDVDASANALATRIGAATAAASPNDPLADGGEVAPQDDTASDGGIPITTVLLWLAIIGGGIWLFVKLRRKFGASKQPADDGSASAAPSSTEPDDSTDDRDVDDIIERARARSRAQAEIDAMPDPSDGWTPPDDF